jgi:hypothetical protein
MHQSGGHPKFAVGPSNREIPADRQDQKIKRPDWSNS